MGTSFLYLIDRGDVQPFFFKSFCGAVRRNHAKAKGNCVACELNSSRFVMVFDRDEDLATLRQQGFKLAVLDTPPAITMAIQSVISVAELIVVPTRPSPHDLRAVGATVDLCERAGKPLVFVVNAATPKAKITSEAAVALSQHGTVAPITLHHRTDFAASMIDGRTVMEVDPESRSAAEVTALWKYIADRLEKNFRRTIFAAPNAQNVMPGAHRPAGGFGRRVAQ